MGLINHWVKNHIPRIDRCLLNHKNPVRRKKGVSLVGLSSAFTFLGLGLGISVLTFLLEIVHYRVIRRHREN